MKEIKFDSYSEWKDIVFTQKNLLHQHEMVYTKGNLIYKLFAIDENIIYSMILQDSSDINDYEENYASSANKNIKKETTLKVNITEESIKQKLIKFDANFTGWSESCNSSNWTLFINRDFDPNILLCSLIINYDNNHETKIVINNETILDASIQELYNMFSSDWKNYDLSFQHFQMVRSGSQYSLFLYFDYTQISNLKIYQKKRSGSGTLYIHEYFISYKDI